MIHSNNEAALHHILSMTDKETAYELMNDLLDRAYCSGAENMRRNLAEWRDPKKTLPVNSKIVLVKLSNDVISVAEYSGRAWWFAGQAPEDNIIGWRPIYENK